MNKIFVLLVIVSAIGICIGQKQRIYGGGNAHIQDHPYQVSLKISDGISRPWHFCGGSIITKNHIVTAAHCVNDKRSPSKYSRIKICTGTSKSNHGGQFYSVKDITIHPRYTGASTRYATYANDIAIITLVNSIEFNEYQSPIRLPSKNIQSGATAVVTGWGKTHGEQVPANLQTAWMYLLPSYECQKLLPVPITNSQVCALYSAGVGICFGDSGGPLTADGELVGIASFVIDCGKGYPDTYTNVYYFLDFINQVINSNSIIHSIV